MPRIAETLANLQATKDWYSNDVGGAILTWKQWNCNYTTTSTATTSTNDYWPVWNLAYQQTSNTVATHYEISTATTLGSTWQTWNGQYWEYRMTNNTPTIQAPEVVIPVPPTAAELAAQAQREQLRQVAEAEAEARALALLKEEFTEEQAAEYAKDKSFTVISKNSKRRYRIRHGVSRNIERIDEQGRKLKTFCAHPNEHLPVYDHMLTQKLFLEHAEEEFLKVANMS